MRRALRLHPDNHREAVTRIEVEVGRPSPDKLVLHYALMGRTAEVIWPPMATPARTDELWRHTCFELFLRIPGAAPYYEFNFSPSTLWAAYRFEGYRGGMAVAEAAPQIAVRSTPERFEMDVTLELAWLTDAGLLRLGLAAVIEETDGRMSYWALNHPSGKPDFHHADGFALELASPS